MLRVVMFDLGLTLVDGNDRPFPHVREALTALSQFKTADAKPLRSCLVSDFTMPTAPVTPSKVDAIFKDYLAILDRTELRPFFEPVKKRATLSTHAGVFKPQREIFETALKRLGARVALAECLFVTENADHVRAARDTLGMQTLQFGVPTSAAGFNDWSQAPGVIANRIAPHQLANREAAVKAHLTAARGIEVDSVLPSSKPNTMRIAAKTWQPISVPGFDDLRDVLVSIPVQGEVTCSPAGAVERVDLPKPSAEDIDEVTSFVHSLAVHGQIEGQARGGASSRTCTHKIETDANGRRRLVRKGFSAV